MDKTHHDSLMKPGEQQIIQYALQILREYQKTTNVTLDNKQSVINFLRLKFELCEREIVSGLFLNHQLRLIAFEELFYGTVNQSTIFPREIVKRALALNATAFILVHNHPSGWPEPSDADHKMTKLLQHALMLVEVKIIDHIIIGVDKYVSFAERRLL